MYFLIYKIYLPPYLPIQHHSYLIFMTKQLNKIIVLKAIFMHIILPFKNCKKLVLHSN